MQVWVKEVLGCQHIKRLVGCRLLYGYPCPCLVGGFLEFQATHPSLCQSQTTCSTSTASGYKCPPLTSMSQPCLPVSNVGPTKILPFLFLGSQQDALSQETMQVSSCLLMTTTTCHVLCFAVTDARVAFAVFLCLPCCLHRCDRVFVFSWHVKSVNHSNSCYVLRR